MILCEEMTQLQAKKGRFFQFWGHNVPINCSEVLGVIDEIKPLVTAFRRGVTHVSMCRIH